jgi:hypothetical protein
MARKLYSDQQMIGRQGEALVKARIHAMGFAFNPSDTMEAGVDGTIEIRDPVSKAATGKLIAVQIKTTQSGDYTRETESSLEYLCDPEDVSYWREWTIPVIVVLVRLSDHSMFWKSTRDGEAPDGRRLRIDKSADALDSSAVEDLAALAIDTDRFGVWMPPLKGGEPLHVNLLRIDLPSTIYTAASTVRSGREARAELLRHHPNPPDEWVLRDGTLISFADPRPTVLKNIVDIDTVEEESIDAIAFSDDEADEHQFIGLLGRALRTQLDGSLVFDKDQGAYHFPAAPEGIGVTYAYRGLKQATSAEVVKVYKNAKDDTKINYVRHHAFVPRFWRLGDNWYLSVTPTFVFTRDGVRPDRYAADRLTKKKKLEKNQAILGQFVMWRRFLCGESIEPAIDLFGTPRPSEQGSIRLCPVDAIESPRSVPERQWRVRDPASASTDQEELWV